MKNNVVVKPTPAKFDTTRYQDVWLEANKRWIAGIREIGASTRCASVFKRLIIQLCDRREQADKEFVESKRVGRK